MDWRAAAAAGDWRAAAVATLDWWREAGVDVLVDEGPRDWLAPPAPSPAPAAPVGDSLPADWAAFSAWRAGPDAPDAGWGGCAIAASGPARARIMVLADCPDRDDEAGSTLLGGVAGRLFDRMLAAIGLSRDEVHLAAVCWKRPRGGRTPAEATQRLHECARHHVGLVAPERLLVLGNAASRAVLDGDVAHTRGGSRGFNHDGREVVVVATHPPRLLLEQRALKADAWADLQLLIKDWTR